MNARIERVRVIKYIVKKKNALKINSFNEENRFCINKRE